MNYDYSIKTYHWLQIPILIAIILISFFFFNSQTINIDNILFYFGLILLGIIFFSKSVTKNQISIHSERILISSSNKLPFSKTKNIEINWEEISAIIYSSPKDPASDDIFHYLRVRFGHNLELQLKTWRYTSSSKNLIKLYYQLNNDIPRSNKIRQGYEKLKKEANSLIKEGILILFFMLALFLSVIIISNLSLSNELTRYMVGFIIFAFIFGTMSTGLIMYFKNKNGSSEN